MMEHRRCTLTVVLRQLSDEEWETKFAPRMAKRASEKLRRRQKWAERTGGEIDEVAAVTLPPPVPISRLPARAMK
jgi:hypothetical protein